VYARVVALGVAPDAASALVNDHRLTRDLFRTPANTF
jgi:hypothetical protein